MDELNPNAAPEELLAIAQDPTRPSWQIGAAAQLAAKRYGLSCEIVKAAAANPNGSLQLLMYVLPVHPCIVMHNPALPLVLLEDPGCLERVQNYALHRILSREDAPVFLCHWLEGHSDPQVAAAARLHLHASNPGTRTWVEEVRARLRPALRRVTLEGSELARLDLAPPSLLARWKTPLDRFSPRDGTRRPVRTRVPAPTGPEARPAESSLRQRIRTVRECTSSETLDQLAGDRRSEVRAAVARNPHTLPATLERLAADPSLDVKYRALANPRVPVAVLLRAVNQPQMLSPILAGAFLENPHTPGFTLAALFRQPWFEAYDLRRQRLARHPHTPAEVLLELANDSNDRVRQLVAHHPRLPAEALPRLRHAAVRAGARSESPLARSITLMHPSLPADLRERALEAYDWLDRTAYALNPSLDEASLRHLADDGNRIVRAAARARLSGSPPPDLWSPR